MHTANEFLLEKEDMTNPEIVPDWVIREYATFNKTVTDKTFPCTFGMTAEKRGELRYSYITHDNWSELPGTIEAFIDLFNAPKLIRHGLFLFVEPEKEEKSLEYYREYFWNLLQYLHEKDSKPWPKDYPTDPDHYLWAFSFANEPFFVFGNAPAYKQRKTRDLGNSLILGFQPRRIFEGLEGTSPGGIMSREKVRERVEKWDQLPKHPNISHYGDPEHREWKQYFIGDDIKPIEGKCPFHHK
ncbi:YqcI/YcgG family protein [Bacillus canaveralius]|uniref:YqcI/YcgG family protein n=1 Tax=Bacillus canaveralius TaxID=1403243 RepID=A0A2N5GMN0_9BACI|nr:MULTISPECIES: YqcI/YcgG family protein [Bacillus]PLR82559.1 YqcI/YcgG family protein [Bacillus sp. V33-4]PLR83183.1 YqcI/YcgG family protein [Bacillus canaveralius]PLR94101.1 YqcI/YcgG family protein [Bacillus canaveralius]RSK44057.1 YqcI/YcgG family protein [Bacillus canaveralius]